MTWEDGGQISQYFDLAAEMGRGGGRLVQGQEEP